MRRLKLPLMVDITDENILALFLFGRSFLCRAFVIYTAAQTSNFDMFFKKLYQEPQVELSLEKPKTLKFQPAQVWPNTKKLNTNQNYLELITQIPFP